MIGVDIDDVLFDWLGKAHAGCEAAGITNGATVTQWECWVDYGCTQDEWLAVMDAMTLDGSLYRGLPFEGAREALQRLIDAGHTIHLVTNRGYFNRGDLIKKHTIDWLYAEDIPHHALTFTKDKTAIRFDVAVDDSERNVRAYRDAGIPCALVDARHNQGFSHPWRVSSLEEFADNVLAGVPA